MEELVQELRIEARLVSHHLVVRHSYTSPGPAGAASTRTPSDFATASGRIDVDCYILRNDQGVVDATKARGPLRHVPQRF